MILIVRTDLYYQCKNKISTVFWGYRKMEGSDLQKMEFSMTCSAKILLHEMTVHWLNQRLRWYSQPNKVNHALLPCSPHSIITVMKWKQSLYIWCIKMVFLWVFQILPSSKSVKFISRRLFIVLSFQTMRAKILLPLRVNKDHYEIFCRLTHFSMLVSHMQIKHSSGQEIH